jgi:hypothetical protein
VDHANSSFDPPYSVGRFDPLRKRSSIAGKTIFDLKKEEFH